MGEELEEAYSQSRIKVDDRIRRRQVAKMDEVEEKAKKEQQQQMTVIHAVLTSGQGQSSSALEHR